MDYSNIFGADGYLAAQFAGYTPRPGQIAFAQAVDEAIRTKRHLLGECPTGTEKSIAYSVPAIYHAVHYQKRVLVVTANIALQEQLVSKDLPMLAEILPWKFSYALLKGRRNYLCPSRMDEDGPITFENPEDAEQYRQIAEWAEHTETGDMSELPFAPPGRVWHKFSISAEDCKGSDCRFRSMCYALKAKQKAEDAHIVVTNYHMLFLHLRLRAVTGIDMVLPQFDIAICDEGHKAADIARDFFGFRAAEGGVRWAGRLLYKIRQMQLAERLEVEAQRFFQDLLDYANSEAYHRRLREMEPVPWMDLHDTLLRVVSVYQKAAAEEPDADTRAGIKRAMARAASLAHMIEEAMLLGDTNHVYFLEELSKGGVALRSKCIEVGEHLRAGLFDETESVIVTSATLTTAGRDFGFAKKELGIRNPKELMVESPFDFEKQALLIVPDVGADPRGEDFSDAVADAVDQVVELAEGRTLGLFTSYRNLNLAYRRIAKNGYRIWRQGQMPRTKLVEEFRQDVSSVLLGTESFWAGVDVPGEALSCVVIDRLPFPSPADPVLDALSERDDGWFWNHSLPRAIIAFKQGFGRLIRSISDRGVVVVLDPRLVTKSYGRQFVASIPKILKSREIENIRHFLSEAA